MNKLMDKLVFLKHFYFAICSQYSFINVVPVKSIIVHILCQSSNPLVNGNEIVNEVCTWHLFYISIYLYIIGNIQE